MTVVFVARPLLIFVEFDAPGATSVVILRECGGSSTPRPHGHIAAALEYARL